MFEFRVNDAQANEEVSRAVGVSMTPYDISFSRWKDGELMGGVIYNRFTHTALQLHTAGFMPNWVCRDFIWLTFHYPFEQLGVDRVFALINEKNELSLKFNLKLGFVVETRVRKVYPDGDQIILVMEKARCRWLAMKPKYMQSNKG